MNYKFKESYKLNSEFLNKLFKLFVKSILIPILLYTPIIFLTTSLSKNAFGI